MLGLAAAITAGGIAIRLSTLGLQSYHHDEIVTAARVLPGTFGHMLHEVRISESNPPLYYVLAWLWSQLFGLSEVGLRSLSALFGVVTIPVAYLIGKELLSRRAGLMTAAIVAVNPMLIWYSQEARSYALVVVLSATAFLFFIRVLRTRSRQDLLLWSVFSALALASHYFAAFPAAVEAAWLLVVLRPRWATAAALGLIGATGLALMPLALHQMNPTHIDWISASPLSWRLRTSGASFLIGETGSFIAEKPRLLFAVIPALLVGVALLLVAWRGGPRGRRAAATGLAVGGGTVVLALGAAAAGHDYVIGRNLLPALVPLAAVAGAGLAAPGALRLGLVLCVALCAYWVAFDIHVAQTPNLQRPDWRGLAARLGPAPQPRAIVTWKLATAPLDYYLDGGQLSGTAVHIKGGDPKVRQVDVVSRPAMARVRRPLLSGFRVTERMRMGRLSLTRYVAPRRRSIPYSKLLAVQTGFNVNGVVLDGVRQ